VRVPCRDPDVFLATTDPSRGIPLRRRKLTSPSCYFISKEIVFIDVELKLLGEGSKGVVVAESGDCSGSQCCIRMKSLFFGNVRIGL